MKKWALRKKNEEFLKELLTKTDITPLAAHILSCRGFDNLESVQDFLSDGELSDPFLLADMEIATNHINDAIEQDEFICIYGDYDCDGVTSTAVLYKYLQCLGANVTYYIPERDEGYGLNKKAVEKLAEMGVNLIITVDNGISAIEEAQLIQQLGMKLIITDHHQPPEELPTALAIVNPHRKDDYSPFKHLAGVGVAMKLLAALEGGNYEAILEQFADIVAIGTIADVVPLVGENRIILRHGLRLLHNTENVGLSHLIESVNGDKPIDSTTVAFFISPKINAAGRFGSPSTAVELFVTEDDPREIVTELNQLNTLRKETENEIILEIEDYILKNPAVLDERVLFFAGKNWHHGVIGIVASRMVERYGKPVFISTIEEDFARGSARSVKGFSIHKALTNCKDLLTKFGGHELAGGYSLEISNIENFKLALFEYAKTENEDMPIFTINADKVLEASDFSTEKIEGLSLLEPFGEGNLSPVFLILNARINKVIPLANGKHIKLEYSSNGFSGEALMFGTSPENFPFKAGEVMDMIGSPKINEYGGRKSISFIVKDYKKSGISQNKYFAAKEYYHKFKRKEKIESNILARMEPERQELIDLYNLVKVSKKDCFIDNLYASVSSEKLNYCKFRLMIDIFEESGFLKVNPVNNSFTFTQPKEKANLESSQTLIRIKNKT